MEVYYYAIVLEISLTSRLNHQLKLKILYTIVKCSTTTLIVSFNGSMTKSASFYFIPNINVQCLCDSIDIAYTKFRYKHSLIFVI